MPFPDQQRVIYGKNPLRLVICQLRFPAILKIEAQVPADFQEWIRKEFANYSETTGLKMEVPAGLEDQLIPPEMLQNLFQSSGIKNYEFSSDDGVWKANLTRTFLALSTSNYTRWERFKERLDKPLHALIDVYSPSQFSRIGLRYVNVIKRSQLNLTEVSWNDLLKPYILGVLGTPDVGPNVQNFQSVYDIVLADGESIARLITGFITDLDGELCYSIDCDFYNANKTEIESAGQRLDFLNKRSSRLIRWCITERLHNAMEPEPI